VHTENFSKFTHESNIHFSEKLGHYTIGSIRANNPEIHPSPLSHVDSHSVHQCLRSPHSQSQTTARSHPKRHPIHSAVLSRYTTLSRQTDRPTDTQTDRWSRRQVRNMSAYARYTDRERRADNVHFLGPTRVCSPNDISIGSAVFAGLTVVTALATRARKASTRADKILLPTQTHL